MGETAIAIESILLSWSGGKDSCMALAEISENRAQPVAGLLSTVTEGFERVSMHGVRVTLLEHCLLYTSPSPRDRG